MSFQNVPDEFDSYINQIIQPLRAIAGRKRVMQEELLAHLLGAYQQELERGSDEPRAIELAKQRLGSPELLGPQLQASVPPFEKLLSMCLGRKETPMSRFLSVVGALAIVVLIFTGMILIFPRYGSFVNATMVAVVVAVGLVRLWQRDELLLRWLSGGTIALIGLAGVAVGAAVILPALAKIKMDHVVAGEAVAGLSLGALFVLEGLGFFVCALTMGRTPSSQG